MPRYLIQSRSTGRFLVPDGMDGSPRWVRSLKEAGGGVVADLEMVRDMIEDLDFDDAPQVVDIERLGMGNDYAR